MKTKTATIIVGIPFCIAIPGHAAPPPSADGLLRRAVSAQGGEEKLRAIQTIHWEGVGYRNELEESERPEGPYLTDFLSLSEIDDHARTRYRGWMETSVYPLYKSVSIIVVTCFSWRRNRTDLLQPVVACQGWYPSAGKISLPCSFS
jgi:hypothetical protein